MTGVEVNVMPCSENTKYYMNDMTTNSFVRLTDVISRYIIDT